MKKIYMQPATEVCAMTGNSVMQYASLNDTNEKLRQEGFGELGSGDDDGNGHDLAKGGSIGDAWD